MTTVTTTDEPREKQIAAAAREERSGYGVAYREELLKRANFKIKKRKGD